MKNIKKKITLLLLCCIFVMSTTFLAYANFAYFDDVVNCDINMPEDLKTSIENAKTTDTKMLEMPTSSSVNASFSKNEQQTTQSSNNLQDIKK